MAKAEIDILFDIFVGGSEGPIRLSSGTLGQHYTDATAALSGLLVSRTSGSQAAGDADLDLPDDAVWPVAAFWDGDWLEETTLGALEALDEDWRSRRGTPTSWLTAPEGESSRTIRVFPTPNHAGTLEVLYRDARTQVPRWLEVPLALELVAREMAQDGKNRDPEVARLSSRLAGLFSALVGPGATEAGL